MSKKYGLIVPGKDKISVPPPRADFTKSSVFGSESSDSDNGNGPQLSKMRAVTIGPGLTERRQARMLQQKALAEDPTIFQYDELYDDIESKRDQEKNSKTKEIKKPKYINRLLLQAERRKLENERRIERTVQKEREAEGEQFKDKESYVTSAYKMKLEELKQAEEEEKRQDYLESIGDVRKQQDLGGFYRHLYEQKLGRNDPSKSDNATTKSINKLDDDSQEETEINSKSIKSIKPRTYRKRHSLDDEEKEIILEKDTVSAKKAHIQSNLDADSDFSIDSSSDSNDSNEIEKQTESNRKINDKEEKSENVDVKLEPAIDIDKNVNNNNSIDNKIIKIKEEKNDEKPKEIKPKKSKIDIWKKRTVGDAFDAALQRYFERKSARNA